MNPRGELCSERISGKDGKAIDNGVVYRRSLSLNSLQLTMSLESRPTWVVQNDLRSGFLKFDPHAEDEVIKSCPSFGGVFEAYTLEKVNNKEHGDDKIVIGTNFYPSLYRMLQEKQEFGKDLHLRGQAIFDFGILEWTEEVLKTFKKTLCKAEIYGVVAVSRYPYEISKNIWRAFCELWGSLSNTLHFADGEMSISLYDLKVIGGLPISGVPYEEFLPTNSALQNEKLYPPTVLELLQIHFALCTKYDYHEIYWDQWLNHFYRGKLMYASIRGNESVPPKPRPQRLPLKISEEGKLAAFLAFWLCRFVLPTWNKTIRPETFHMACLMARGVKVSIAPTTLGYIYHRLREIACHPLGQEPPKVCFPIHYVIGWLGEYFSQSSRRSPDSDFAANYPRLARYACIIRKDFSINCTRIIFRGDRSVVYRPHAFFESKGQFLFDDETLSDERIEYMICLRSACLPVRVDDQLILEPYYPNRFAPQFGYDQSVPSNRLSFCISKRKQYFVEDLARAQSIIFRRKTAARFYVPRSTYEGRCTWWYCKWWLKACIPYLGLSVSKTFKAVYQKPPEPECRIFRVNKLAEISRDLQKTIKVPSLEKQKSESPRTSASKDQQSKSAEETCTLRERLAAVKGRKLNTAQTRDNTQGTAKAPVRKLPSIVVPKPLTNNQNIDVTESDSSSTSAHPKRKREACVKSDGKSVNQTTILDNPPLVMHVTTAKEKTIVPNSLSLAKCIPSAEDVEKFLLSVFDPALASFMKNYLIGLVSDLVMKISSSEAPADLLAHSEEIKSSLSMLRPVIDSLKSGNALFEKFTSTFEDMLKATSESSRNMSILKESTGVDVDFASDLISDYERCMKIKDDLCSRLADSSKKLKDLEATDLEIKAEEERFEKKRKKCDSEKASVKNNIALLKDSIKEQNKQAQSLLKDQSDFMKDKLPEIKQAISSNKLETEKFQKTFDCFISLFPTA